MILDLSDQSINEKKLTLRIVGSENMMVRMYSNSSILVSISFIGLERDFFSIAQIPTVTASFVFVMVDEDEKFV